MSASVVLLPFVMAIASFPMHFSTIEPTTFAQQNQARWQERSDFAKYFKQAGVEGTFVLYDLQQDQYFVHNSKRANTRFLPASTFKIFNSLVALEVGAVKNENQVLKWDGVQRPFPEWNQDQTMRTAIKDSVIWFYQEIARRVGQERMQRYINLTNYGNQNISGGIDQFWLQGGLQISAKEQIDFLVKLYRDQLPFSQRTMNTVKDILINERTPTYVLRGKTGWLWDASPNQGWYVGYLERGDRVYFFAINIDMPRPEDRAARTGITKQILHDMRLLE